VPLKANVFDDYKDIKQAKKLADKFKKLNANTSIFELDDVLKELRRFAEKKAGYKISFRDLKGQFKENLREQGIPYLDIFDDIYEILTDDNLKSKGLSPERRDHLIEYINELPGGIPAGIALMIASPLFCIIAIGCPPAAPYCYTATRWMLGMGASLVAEGLVQLGDEKRNQNRP
jgi:hypothetical protein